MNKKIRDHKIPFIGKINDRKVSSNETLYFSFKHTDLSHEKFEIKSRDTKYFLKLFERFKSISRITVQEFISNRSSSLRSHPINWKETTEKNGFDILDEQLKDCPSYQFEISGNKHGRAHGLLLENVFYIVWFDPNHELYPSKKR